MKILKLLNKIYFSIIFTIILSVNSFAEDTPIDIWDLNKKSIEGEISNNEIIKKKENNKIETTESTIYKMQNNNQNDLIKLEQNIDSQIIKIIGLYDPEDYGLDINMWSNSDGDQLKYIFSKLNKIDLSDDANEIVQIALFTNSYNPKKNISEKEFLKFKSDWMIKNSNFELIEEYLLKNQAINSHPNLTKFIIDYYLSNANLKKACQLFEKNSNSLFLSKQSK